MRTILAIDLKSFYASVECVDRGLDPFNTPLVVADASRGEGTIVMAASPYIKTLGVPSRCRLYEVPKMNNLIIATPRMARYIEKSCQVLNIYLKYVAEEDLHIYSIDEALMDITGYLHGMSPKEYAKKIINDVYQTTGLRVTAGIGPNMFLAKVAMDIEAKKAKDFIAEWSYSDIKNKLWPLTPLSKLWGIGHRLEKRLNDMGFMTIGDIAAGDVNYLRKKLGVIGEELYDHSHGIDETNIREKYVSASNSLSVGQTLFQDYSKEDCHLLLIEMIDELIVRLKSHKKLAGCINLWCMYADHSGGFSKGFRLKRATDDFEELKENFELILMSNLNTDTKVRGLSLCAGELVDDSFYQISLFDGEKEMKDREMYKAIAHIKAMYGQDSLVRMSALTKMSTAIRRMNQIGGHRR